MPTIVPSQTNLTISQMDTNGLSKNFDTNKYIELDESTTDKLVNLTKAGNERNNYNNLLNNELFRAVKNDFLSDIQKLKDLAYIYLGNEHQDDVEFFYKRIDNPPNSDMIGQFDFYVNSRKHIHFLVQKLIEDQTLQKTSNTPQFTKSSREASEQITVDDKTIESSEQIAQNRDFLVMILADSLQGMTECLPGIHTRLTNVYNSLKVADQDNSTSYISRIKKGRLDYIIRSLISKFNKEGKLDIPKQWEVHYFSAFHDLCCEHLKLSKINDFFAPESLSDDIKTIVKTEVFAVVDDIIILRDLVEEYCNNLDAILKKHNIPLNSFFSIYLITNDLNQKIDKVICSTLNAHMKDSRKSLNVDKFIEFDLQNHDLCCFKRRKELLMAWLTSQYFKLCLNSKIFTILPFTDKKKLCIGGINNTFFWVFIGESRNIGQNCTFNPNNHISLSLPHLKSVDFSSWKPSSISYALLTQALNQTEKTEDIVAFFCDPCVINQLKIIPKSNYEKLMLMLSEKITNNQSFKNNILQSVFDYIETPQIKWKTIKSYDNLFGDLLIINHSYINNRMHWLINTPILEPVLIKLFKQTFDISEITTAINYQQIKDFSVTSIRKIFSKTQRKELFINILESKTVQFESLDKLIQIDPELCTLQNSTGITALHLAVINGNVHITKKLLNYKKIDVNAKDYDGQTPLFFAAKFGHVECVTLLLNKDNIDVNIKDNNRQTPLFLAAIYGNAECLDLLLKSKKAHVNTKNNNQSTALTVAVYHNYIECVKLLLKEDDIDVNVQYDDGQTPLSIAAYYGYYDCLFLLLIHPNINTNTRCSFERTALHMAVENAQDKCIFLLLKTPNFDVTLKDCDGWTAIHTACDNGCVKSLKILLADDRIDVNTKDNNGKTAFDYEYKKANNACMSALMASGKLKV